MPCITLTVSFKWEPWLYDNQHMPFQDFADLSRRSRERCSVPGAAVYKWKGHLAGGPHEGQLGVYYGETDDVFRRFGTHYRIGRQETNKRVREDFLKRGDIYPYVLSVTSVCLSGEDGIDVGFDPDIKTWRLLVEQLLIAHHREAAEDNTWLVNRQADG